MLSEYFQALQIVPPIVTAQILLVPENDVFYNFFKLELSKKLYKNLTKLEILNSVLGCCQGTLSKSKSSSNCDFSNPFSF